eukprot:1045897-Prorocentrum_minimum.AAC.2
MPKSGFSDVCNPVTPNKRKREKRVKETPGSRVPAGGHYPLPAATGVRCYWLRWRRLVFCYPSTALWSARAPPAAAPPARPLPDAPPSRHLAPPTDGAGLRHLVSHFDVVTIIVCNVFEEL